MALTPLTGVQQATVLALVEARRLAVVTADAGRATSFLRHAEERLDQLPLLTSVAVRYGIAYDACHDTSEALLRVRPPPTRPRQDRYEAKPVGAAVTKKAEQVARTLFDAALLAEFRCDRQRTRTFARSSAGSDDSAWSSSIQPVEVVPLRAQAQGT